MRSFLFCLFLIVGENAYPSPNIIDGVYDDSHSNLDENGYHNSFEDQVRNIIKESLVKIGPVVHLQNRNYNFPKTQSISGDVNVSYFEATGINALDIKQLKVNEADHQLEFTFAIPNIHLFSYFLFNLTIAHLIPLYTHNGKANTYFGGVVIKGTSDIKPGNPITVSNVKATCTLNQLTVNFHGILNNEEFSYLLSSIINVNGEKFINSHPQLLSNTFSPLVEVFVNFLLSEGSSLTTTTESTTTTTPTETTTVSTSSSTEGTTTVTESTSSSTDGTTTTTESTSSSTEGTTASPESTSSSTDGTITTTESTSSGTEGTTASPESTSSSTEGTTSNTA